MAIKVVPDVVAPLAVTAVDLATTEWMPQANEWVTYGMVAAGYIGAGMGMGGDLVKNIGIASLPLAAKKVYTRVRSGVSRNTSSQLALKKIASKSSSGGSISTSRPEFSRARLF